MKRKASAIILSAAFILALTACEGKRDEKPTDPSSSEPTTSEPTSEPSTTDTGSTTEDTGTTTEETTDTSSSSSILTKYTITFKDEVGNLLEAKEWDEGTIPFYNYEKEDTAEWDYTVEGWSLTQGGDVIEIPAVSADATYFAIVSQLKQSYQITFYDEKGNELQSGALEYGAQPSCDYVGPTNTQEWTYAFAGWATSLGGTPLSALPTVTENADYYAVVSQTKNKYTITFETNGGSVVAPVTEDYGTQINEPASPEKENCEFVNWSTDEAGQYAVIWPYTITENKTFYANWLWLKTTMSLDKDSALVSMDKGNYKEARVDGLKFNILGHEEVEGKFGSIERKVYGNREAYGYDYTYNGMVYNRSAIPGLTALKVDYTGDPIKVVYTEYLMENMDFNGEAVTTGVKNYATEKASFFILYTEGTSVIESIKIEQDDTASITNEFIFDASSTYGGARSLGKSKVFDDSTIEIENNPTANTNNYSRGKHVSNAHDDAWYRWNGYYAANSENLGPHFEFHMTVLGNISQAIDPNDYFNFSIWPQFKHAEFDPEAYNYHMIYFGNDNYEPLGKDNTVYPSDPYTQQAYAGRFFADYDENYDFADPDVQKMPGSDLTLRQAYEKYTLPYWHCKFVGDAETNNLKVYVNGILYLDEQLIDNEWEEVSPNNWVDRYEYHEGEEIVLYRLQMHLVNYGTGEEEAPNTPRESYKGVFTFPRLAK